MSKQRENVFSRTTWSDNLPHSLSCAVNSFYRRIWICCCTNMVPMRSRIWNSSSSKNEMLYEQQKAQEHNIVSWAVSSTASSFGYFLYVPRSVSNRHIMLFFITEQQPMKRSSSINSLFQKKRSCLFLDVLNMI